MTDPAKPDEGLPYHKAPASLAKIDQWLHVDCSACKRPISGCHTDSTCEVKGAMCGIRAIAQLANTRTAQCAEVGVSEEQVKIALDAYHGTTNHGCAPPFKDWQYEFMRKAITAALAGRKP